ncbi:hypothetical protein DOJK_01650 [Patescibacteria group bacterium]|nr:hypothetical protein DOJK_01650 [Patescibacteria group bacterium]
MKSEDVDAICKIIVDINDPDLINQQLDKVSNEDMVDLTNKFLERPFQFKSVLILALNRLFDDTADFAEIFNNFYEKTYLDLTPLREGTIKKQKQIFSLVKRLLHIGKPPGNSAGIFLSWVVQEMDEAENFMIEGLNSNDLDLQRCSLIALNSIISNADIQDKSKYFDILKNVTSNISQENISLLIFCLQRAFEGDEDSFGTILESEIIRRGIKGAKDYIQVVHGRSSISVSILQKAVEIVESEEPESDIVDMGLAKIYESKPGFVVEKLKKRLIDHESIRLADGFLLYRINEIGPKPVIEMLESLINEGNSVMLNIGESILEDFFPHFEDNANWVAWCENWRDDTRKERIIFKSLGLILSKLINYKPSEVRDRAIALVKYFAIKNGIDYDAETRRINLKGDPKEGKENKESTIKTLYILDRILNPPAPIDVKTLSDNLEKAPHLSKAIDAEWLIKSASTRNPHPLAYIFCSKLPGEEELERLRKKLEIEEDKNKKAWLAFDYERLLRKIKYQTYWENVFRALEEYGVIIGKKKLQDIDNAWNILAEAEILSRLASCFDIRPEPDIPELGSKKLDALIEYEGEKALIEVRTVQERLEETLTHGVVSSIPGGKVKSVLRDKFERQLKGGTANPSIPILIVLCLEGFMGFMDMVEVRNAIYGALQFSYKIRNDTHEIVEEGTKREENAFYDIQGTEIVTAIGAYRRDYDKDDPLVGKLHHPYKPPTNKMSQKFKLRLRGALFGNSEISDMRSLMRIPIIDVKMAKLLYANGIEDLGVLAGIRENDFVIEGVSWEELSQLQKEAIRVIKAISTGSVKFLKGIDQKTITILQSNKIYLINRILELDSAPEGIPHEVWSLLKEDAMRILGS